MDIMNYLLELQHFAHLPNAIPIAAFIFGFASSGSVKELLENPFFSMFLRFIVGCIYVFVGDIFEHLSPTRFHHYIVYILLLSSVYYTFKGLVQRSHDPNIRVKLSTY